MTKNMECVAGSFVRDFFIYLQKYCPSQMQHGKYILCMIHTDRSKKGGFKFANLTSKFTAIRQAQVYKQQKVSQLFFSLSMIYLCCIYIGFFLNSCHNMPNVHLSVDLELKCSGLNMPRLVLTFLKKKY